MRAMKCEFVYEGITPQTCSSLFRSKRKRKKKIRRILDDAELGEETKRKIAIEKVSLVWWCCSSESEL